MILLILTYLAGVLTILSPCILPVLPFVFSRSQGSFLKNGVPLLIGMALTFSLLSGLALAGGEWIGKANEFGRWIALGLMAVFGISLLIPHISEAAMAPLTRLGSRIGRGTREDSIGGSVLIGVGTGLLWAPCAGPILGLVLTGAATQGNVGSSIGLLLSYSLGAATSLGLAIVAGNRFLKTLKKFLGIDQLVKKALGLAVLVGVAAIAFNLDRTVLTQVSKISTESFEHSLLNLGGLSKKEEKFKNSMMMMSANSGGEVAPVIEGLLPEFEGAVSWLNSEPLSIETLRGKVVLIDFWTYSCINCLRTLPYLKAWHEKYKDSGLVIIGVHTPEFAFEKSADNVKKAVSDLGVIYPVAIDSNYKIWNAFKNQYWPAHYFVDRLGRIRHHHFGEGEYETSEDMIRKLLSENGAATLAAKEGVSEPLGRIAHGLEASGSSDVQSPETYIGYARAENFVGSREFIKDQAADYKSPSRLSLNQWSLMGKWIVENERALSKSTNGKVSYRFKARDLHLVLGGDDIPFRVKIDGHAPEKNHGVDTDESGQGKIGGHRLYQLIRQQEEEPKDEHTFEIEFLKPGAEVYAFTFG